ncbi:Leucine-rich repeat receptor protein kinase EMS1 [Citrus sinensis]|uniref:Leucine-rich repeat receptor protein kinase EMS1 n=1 Tax=Citrus sinensis TaxID=2711 RepID=A0ACB8JG35_CITSI|nr:Leucine-rich repeat receptor protein kinase EMS1 [Citrus sinensis]
MLKYIRLSNNKLSGPIPRELCESESLVEINLDGNMLSGTIEDVFDRCTNLSELVLVNNRISGSIPEYISELPLKVLDLQYNNFTGVIPVSLWNSENLMEFNAASNLLEGSLSWEIGNAVALEKLDLSSNMLTGRIPKEIGNLTGIQILKLKSNFFDGIIPMELGDCISLNTLDLGNNNLNGSIPEKIADLTQLQFLDLSHNNLSGPIPSKPSFYFREALFHQNLVTLKLQGLYLGYNQLTGSIPRSLGRLNGLVKLNLTADKLSGSVPTNFGNLNGLTHLDLSYNELDGELPSSLSHILGIEGLYVQSNKLSGPVDKLFLNSVAWKIAIMNLSNNFFDGGLPQSLSTLSYLIRMDFHLNKLTGEIPSDLGNLVHLEYLDFSRNMLGGPIPEKMCSLPNLLYMNLADNRLEGEVPRSGICQNLSIISLAGNKDLCGKSMGSDCQILTFGKLALVGIVVGSVFVIAIIVSVLWWWIQRSNRQSDPKETGESKQNSISNQNRKSISDRSSSALMEHLSINLGMFEPSLQKLTYDQIVAGTNKFCEENVIGGGGFGTVFKVDEEKLLVYEYMVKGSLDDWLRNRAASLDWGKRCKIVGSAARGLAFLHHGFQPHIIHRDIKASNILLNDDFEAKISDFGLARLISDCESHVSTVVAGTIGYVPPEYGGTGKATERGDVYSFGVILLELVTGKQPTGPEFEDKDGENLVDWVLHMMKNEQANEVLDPAVLNANSKPTMLKMLQIATGYISNDPTVRPTMLHVLELIENIIMDEPPEEIKIERGESSGTKDIQLRCSMEKAEAKWYDHNSSKIGKILKKDHSFTFNVLVGQIHVCVLSVDEQHKEPEQLRDLTSARNVETLKLKIMKLRRRRSLKENSLLLKRARIQFLIVLGVSSNFFFLLFDVHGLGLGSLSDMDDSTATFAEADSLDLLGAIVLDNVSGTFDIWNKFYANSTSGPG